MPTKNRPALSRDKARRGYIEKQGRRHRVFTEKRRLTLHHSHWDRCFPMDFSTRAEAEQALRVWLEEGRLMLQNFTLPAYRVPSATLPQLHA